MLSLNWNAAAGDSFGRSLSAQVDPLAARRPDLQVLIYPLVDMTLTKPSIERHAEYDRSVTHALSSRARVSAKP